MMRLAAGWVACGLIVSVGRTAEPAVERGRHTLFSPTPKEAMREFNTDRPDQTESPYTVDAGHFQLEMDLVNYTRDREGGITTDLLSVAPINLKAGLLPNVDLQLIFDPYLRARVKAGNSATTVSGHGDFQARLKVNLWGNDEGTTAFAMMPFVKAPTARDVLGNGAVEGGVIFPLAIGLGERFGLGLMTEFDFVRNFADDGYRADYVNSITLACDLTERLGAYVEFFSIVRGESGRPWEGQFDVGTTYALRENVQLDAGVNIGITRNAPDWQPFLGVSFRY